MIFLVVLTGCGGGQTLRVADVIQNAEGLDEKTVRVRGQAFIWMDPSKWKCGCLADEARLWLVDSAFAVLMLFLGYRIASFGLGLRRPEVWRFPTCLK